jgi:hypothetical protein
VPETTLTFENGATLKYQNYAEVKEPLRDIRSGEPFYQKFCNSSLSLLATPSIGSSSTEYSADSK